MALLFADSFDHLDTADLDEKYTSVTGSPTVGSTYKRNGTNGVQLSSGDYLNLTLAPTTAAAGVCGMAIYRIDSGASSFWDLRNGEGRQMYLRIETDATLTLYDKDNNELDDSGGTTISATQWHYLECKWTINNSGSFQVYLDGGSSPILNYAGDTSFQTSVTWTEIRWGIIAGNELYMDDIYVLDQTAATYGPSNDDILGDIVVKCVLPNADGDNSAFTPSTGTVHFELVNDTTPNTTDYVSSGTASQIDTWNFTNLGVTGTILGVQLSLYAQKSDSGTRTLAGVAWPVSTARVGDTQTPTTSWRYYRECWDYNPETDSDWTVATVDAAEFGVKVIA